jgi:8-oxo-dGTP pyrophosphatase MutT (NUDIX family)
VKLYAGIIPVGHDGRIALQMRDNVPHIENPGMITTFGGSAEDGEDSAAAAIREAGEELGLALQWREMTEILTWDKREHEAITRCVFYAAVVSDVDALTVYEGQGAVVGYPAELLVMDALTETCRRAVLAFSERHQSP